ncbi:DUF1987 domain-containing protein [bacterium]|nr:DUF1987 domain-containing protein [bacterium]
MDNLRIAKTKYTADVHFDAESGILEIEGSSYPENAFEYFQPLARWIRIYITETEKPIIFNLRLQYMNTSSSKCLLDILYTLEEHLKAGRDVEINWYYQEDDEDSLETGEELSYDMELKFNFIPN